MKNNDKVELLDKANDVSAFAGTDPARRVITGVYANGKGVEASDGRVLIRVPYVQIDASEFPDAGGTLAKDRKAAIIPTKALQEALQSTPKRVTLPILACVRLATAGEKIQLATTDLETSRVIEATPIEGNFPDVRQCIPESPATLTIAFAADVLKRIADYALKHGAETGNAGPTVKFELIASTDAARFSIQLKDQRVAEGVLMPVRIT